ncbi:RidA family protein [Oceanobacillus jeddahense]|uniref:RidA family protein n=1 Tax=Oceanobacillus jeddahense TaxID=1462527 RepID=UPI000595D22D|nr:RidA family protein [Oceanobacillus jeddahense]
MSLSKSDDNPIPQGKYVPSSRFGDLIFTSGMTPRRRGILIQQGKVSEEEPLESYKEAVEQAASNALSAANSMLDKQEKLEKIISLNVYIYAEENFQAHSSLADFASEYFYHKLGQHGIGSRAAIGVSSLPDSAPFEIQLIAACAKY